MKITKIHFEQLFPTGNFANQRLGVEMQLEEDDSELEAFRQAKIVVNKAFCEINMDSPGSTTEAQYQSFQPEQIPVTQREKPSTIESLSQDISNAKDMAELDTFRLLASTNPTLQDAYDNRLKQLQLLKNQQS